ncbi:SDR family NAD(P)-dependent oxidoreductase [Salisediminibacterium halotolerans]|uniref:SDR family NAD(P)-dependent oxidoreductase n=1 Tax=Salisediminibacterium halotolerans TaxID=517425 RepID=UPI000EB3022C|nr:SDR family oxidoreductase [Salisediminibacterium halotolerans]RLJ75517.1 NAD(P)-dependent dehydrogenase (short-subunit alcohol dehydrogenase family) [Actinophytocola xinjiangensis]RPE89370.1 NAD(P)-dependent dehydrogenase (short-subunit alcohol dehydrogenase family) [Salisediminibacterium halotolerans]TWG36130.1 NAD(P)-dependent dehydrogenase (short-subunit alcohol dehydrogenase family) [Salisediminibacterium halotolerans]GEL08132.1 short-chain dehydrogenase [Salisediminibacterium halotolera
MRLSGKVAVVTGGASGIGEAAVRRFVSEGAKVVIADINDHKGAELVAEIGDSVVYQHVDVTDETEVEAMVAKAETTYGKLDILFNNAGIGSLNATDELSLEDWRKIMAINMDGVFLCAKHAIKAMKRAGGGSIINTASILGHVGQAQTGPYSASKGGVANFTRALAVEYAQEKIRVNAVCPGYTRTPLLEQLDDDMLQYLISLHPVNRLGEAEEIANAVLFLASDEASFITGENLLVDGGYTAR